MLQYGTKIRLWIFPELLIFSPHTLWSAWLFYTCKQKGKQMDEQFMRKKAVLPLITSMALPMVLSMLVNALYNIVDSYFVARISEDAMTALSLVYPLQNLVNAIAIGFGVGISAVIALYLGAGKRQSADRAATQGMLWALVHGVLLTGVCIAIIPLFLQAFTKDQAVINLGVRYGRIVFGFSIIINADLAFEKIFQAVGRMKVTMVGLGLGCLANIILDPLLIFGLGPFPKMGIDGAALATGLGQVLTLVIYLLFYYLRPISVKIRLQHLRPSRHLVGRLYAIGIPAILNLALPSLLISALNAILAAFSQTYVLILGAYYKLQTFLYLPANGIVQGMRPVIGFNYGAKEYGRVKQIFRTVLVMTAAIMVVGTVLCLVIPGQLIGLFTENAATVAAGKTALRIISGGFIVSAVSVTASGALEGLGKGTPSLVISLCRYLVIIVPLAFLLSRVLGTTGVWHAFWIAELFTAGIALAVYRKAVQIKD